MASALGSVRAYVPSASQGEGVASGRVPAAWASTMNVCRKSRDDRANQHEVALAPERRDVRAGEEAATTFPKSPDVAIRSPSRSPVAPPVDAVANEDIPALDTHLQVSAAASGQACDGDQEAGLEYSWDPAADPGASSPRTSGDPDGDDDLYDLGVAAAMAMDTKTLLQEVATYFGREANREQRPLRRVATQRNAAPPVKFSLRLSDEEAREDVVAVSPAMSTMFVKLEAEVPALCHTAKRRRR